MLGTRRRRLYAAGLGDSKNSTLNRPGFTRRLVQRRRSLMAGSGRFQTSAYGRCCLSQKGSIRLIGDVCRLNNGIDGGAVERQGPETWVESYPL